VYIVQVLPRRAVLFVWGKFSVFAQVTDSLEHAEFFARFRMDFGNDESQIHPARTLPFLAAGAQVLINGNIGKWRTGRIASWACPQHLPDYNSFMRHVVSTSAHLPRRR
jgi:hypothetical protein